MFFAGNIGMSFVQAIMMASAATIVQLIFWYFEFFGLVPMTFGSGASVSTIELASLVLDGIHDSVAFDLII